MRIFLWQQSDDVFRALNKNSLLFDGDHPDGGCVVICGFCSEKFNEHEKTVCPGCGRDLIFPRADW